MKRSAKPYQRGEFSNINTSMQTQTLQKLLITFENLCTTLYFADLGKYLIVYFGYDMTYTNSYRTLNQNISMKVFKEIVVSYAFVECFPFMRF